MKLIRLDYWGGAAPTISALSEATGFPAANTQHIHLSKKWRTTGLSTEWIKAQFSSAVPYDSFAIAGHNLTSAATVRVQANSSDSWATPPFDILLNPADPVMFTTFAAQSYAWWRLLITDAGNPDGFIAIGRIMLGTLWDSVEPIGAGLRLEMLDSSRVQASISGQRFSDVGIRQRVYHVTMGGMKDTTRLGLELVANGLRGIYPTVVDIADGVPRLYATIVKEPGFTAVGAFGWTDDGIEFKEAT